jgi:hypothetical protein
MKTKEKTRRPANNGAAEKLFPAVKESEMTSIDRKIHDLLIAEGYRATCTGRLEGIKLNHFTNVDRIEYIRGEHERVFVITHEPRKLKETA